jgi:hypothetical protein
MAARYGAQTKMEAGDVSKATIAYFGPDIEEIERSTL